MTIKSLALVTAMLTLAIPSSVAAQTGPLMSGPISAPRPSGSATGTTDRQGQTKKPAKASHVSTPTQAPYGHLPLPLPRIRKGR